MSYEDSSTVIVFPSRLTQSLKVLSTCTTLASSSPAAVEEETSFFFPRTSSINSEGFSINLRNPASGSSLPKSHSCSSAFAPVLNLKGCLGFDVQDIRAVCAVQTLVVVRQRCRHSL